MQAHSYSTTPSIPPFHNPLRCIPISLYVLIPCNPIFRGGAHPRCPCFVTTFTADGCQPVAMLLHAHMLLCGNSFCVFLCAIRDLRSHILQIVLQVGFVRRGLEYFRKFIFEDFMKLLSVLSDLEVRIYYVALFTKHVNSAPGFGLFAKLYKFLSGWC